MNNQYMTERLIIAPGNTGQLFFDTFPVESLFMKPVFFFLLFFLILQNMSYSQCDKHTIITSSKTEYLDANNTVQHTETENTIIEITKTEIIITPGDDKERINRGKIDSAICKWTKPYKEGQTIIKAVFVNKAGDTKHGTITISGKNGKVVFLMEAEENPEFKVRVIVERFEEKK